MAPVPAPRLRKGSDAPWPSVPPGKEEAPKASGAPQAGVGSAGEAQAQASPQEGTEAQGARPSPGTEDRGCRNALGGQKAEVEVGVLGNRTEANEVDTEQAAGVRGVSTQRSEVRAGEAKQNSKVTCVDAEQRSKVRHVDTVGPEATGVMSEAGFQGAPEAPPRGSQERTGVRPGDEAPTMQGSPPAEPAGHCGHFSNFQGARAAAGQEREGAEVRGGASGVRGTGLEQGPSVGVAGARPQVSRYPEAPPTADQRVMSRDLGLQEAETGDLTVLGTETVVAEPEVWGTQETETEGSGFPKVETGILEAHEAEAARLGLLETEAAGMAEPEKLQTQETEAGASAALEAKSRLAEAEAWGTQEIKGASGALRIEAEIAEPVILGAQETQVEGLGVPAIEDGRAETKILGTQETEVGGSGVLAIKSETSDTREAELGGSEVPGFESETAEVETSETQEGTAEGSGVSGMQTATAGAQKTEGGHPGVSGLGAEMAEAGGLGAQQTETAVLEAEKAKISGVLEAETGLRGSLANEAFEASAPKRGVLGSQGAEAETSVLRVQEAEAEALGMSEAKSGVWGAREAEMEGLGLPENQSGIFEAQEAEAGVLGTEKGKEAEASLTEARVASGAGAGVPGPSGASPPEEPEEDRRLPGSQVGMGAAAGPVFRFPLTRG